MSYLEDEDLFLPNTVAIRHLLQSLNYGIVPINARSRRVSSDYRAICFKDSIEQFECLKNADYVYYCMNRPNLTEDQAIFVFSILHVCPDYQTFKDALQEYINSNP